MGAHRATGAVAERGYRGRYDRGEQGRARPRVWLDRVRARRRERAARPSSQTGERKGDLAPAQGVLLSIGIGAVLWIGIFALARAILG